jgi:hypothetical protein
MRDGAVRVEFVFVNHQPDSQEWFGVFFRAGDDPFIASYLVYVRQNGMIEIAAFPGTIILGEIQTTPIEGTQRLIIEFENDYLNVQLGENQLGTDALSYQKAGYIWPAVHCTNADVLSLEMICRDTLEMV